MTARGEAALYQAATSGSYRSGMCLRWVRERYDIAPKNGTAIAAWRDLSASQRVKDLTGRRGYPFFWYAGANRAGHIAICTDEGVVRSTDWPRTGQVGQAYIRDISRRWGMTPLGYGLVLNSVRVVCPTVDLSSIIYCARHAPHSHEHVSTVEQALAARGLFDQSQVNDSWTKATTAAYAAWQRRLGYSGSDANGVPGAVSLRRLARLEPHFIVVP